MFKKDFKKLSNNDIKAAKSLKAEAEKVFGNQLLFVVAYGSRVEGKAKKDSDLDIFLLTKKRPKISSKESEKLSEIAMSTLENYNVYPSIVAYGEKEFKNLENTPYIFWLKKTGVLL